jgi:hypothetical protein
MTTGCDHVIRAKTLGKELPIPCDHEFALTPTRNISKTPPLKFLGSSPLASYEPSSWLATKPL